MDAAEVRSSRGEDSPQQETSEQPLLICPNCDESFAPRFYRICEDCGHDFGFGVELKTESSAEVNYRAAIIVGGLTILAIAAVTYFWLLFN